MCKNRGGESSTSRRKQEEGVEDVGYGLILKTLQEISRSQRWGRQKGLVEEEERAPSYGRFRSEAEPCGCA